MQFDDSSKSRGSVKILTAFPFAIARAVRNPITELVIIKLLKMNESENIFTRTNEMTDVLYTIQKLTKSYFPVGNIFKEDEPQEGRTGRGVLSDCREYLANYQESYSTPRTEYSFAALITMMVQATAQSLWALLYVFINIIPVIQVIMTENFLRLV